MPRILVAGFGNELLPGDACAKRVVESLGGFECLEARWLGRGVQALIHLAPKYDVIVAVDSSTRVERGRVEVKRLEGGECNRELQSLHEAGLLEAACMALEVAEALGSKPLFYLVECGVRDAMDSEGAERAIREAVRVTRSLVEGLCRGSQG